MTEKKFYFKFKDGKPVGAVVYDKGERMTKPNERYQSLLRDEFRGYFGLLKVKSATLSELAIVEKIQRDVSNILKEVYEE